MLLKMGIPLFIGGIATGGAIHSMATETKITEIPLSRKPKAELFISTDDAGQGKTVGQSGDIDIEPEFIAIVDDGSRQGLKGFLKLAFKSKGQSRVMYSLDVVDSYGDVWIDPVQSEIIELRDEREDQLAFDVPPGLPDGDYMVRLAVAFNSPAIERGSVIERLYFRIDKGRAIPLDAEEYFQGVAMMTFQKEGSEKQ